MQIFIQLKLYYYRVCEIEHNADVLHQNKYLLRKLIWFQLRDPYKCTFDDRFS